MNHSAYKLFCTHYTSVLLKLILEHVNAKVPVN